LDVLFSAGLLTLAFAVVLLFAMVGELGALAKHTQAGGMGQSFLKPLTSAPLGRSPEVFPPSLRYLADAEMASLIVLSTSCQTCTTIAPLLRKHFNATMTAPVSVVVSCPQEPVGIEFVKQYGLADVPHWVDVGGAWLREHVGINTSPTCLMFSRGSLRAALAFSDVDALFALMRALPDASEAAA
jgi:hypothetical protein